MFELGRLNGVAPLARVLVLLSPLLTTPKALAREISLNEVLDLAEKTSPEILARRSYESAAAAAIGSAKAGYLPTANAQAIDSTGFPGSTGYLGLGGVVGSPFRSGAGVGVTVTETIYDFGRTDAQVALAEKGIATREQATLLAAQQARMSVLHVYIDCERMRTQVALFHDLLHDTEVVAKEVKNFVRTGQRSVVDRYLSEAQVEQAKTAEATAAATLEQTQKALAIFIGERTAEVTCPALGEPLNWNTPADAITKTPYVAAAIAGAEEAKGQEEVARTAYRPKLELLGSLGWMQDTRLVKSSPYAIGVGLDWPIFNGFKDTYDVQQASANSEGRRYEVESRKLEIEEANARYDEQIVTAATKLAHLPNELQLAKKAFKVAKNRYFEAEGGLFDLREAIRNLCSTEVEMIDARAASIEAIGAKALVNGGRLGGL